MIGAFPHHRLGLLALGGLAVLGGCVRMPALDDPSVDMKSPTAAAISQVIANPGAYPTFADIPPIPTDLPPTGAAALAQSRTAMLGQSGLATDTTGQSEAFAAAQRQATSAAAAPTAADQAAIDAFAAAQRARAIPPSGR